MAVISARWTLSPLYNKSATNDIEIIFKTKSLWMNYFYKTDLKTLWQKEKLLIMSNLSFFHNVFKSRLRQKEYVGKG